MATKNILVRAGADFSAITKQAKTASKSMKGLGTSFSSAAGMAKRAFSALGVAVSLAAVVSAAKSAKEAFDAQAESEAKLAQVMRNTMGASSAEVQTIKDLTAAQQALGVVSDEIQLAGAQELATYLSQTESLKKLIPVMNDMVAQQYGYSASAESAANIATMLGKVMNGQTGALSRYGYTFDKAQEQILKFGNEEQRAAVLADVVSESVGGMNEALAQTPTGRLKQLSNTLGDIKERFGQAVTTLGTAFLPLLNRVASLLSSIANMANRVAQSIANVFGKKLTVTSSSAAGTVSNAASAVDGLGSSLKSAGQAAKEAARSVLGFDVLNKLSDISSSGSGSGSSDAEDDLGGGYAYELSEGEDAAAESATKLERMLQKIKNLIGSINFEPMREAMDRFRTAAQKVAEVIGSALSWAFDNVLTPLAHWTIEKFLPQLLTNLANAMDLIRAVAEKLAPIFQKLWQNILEPFFKKLGELWINLMKSWGDAIAGIAEKVSKAKSVGEFLDSLKGKEKFVLGIVSGLTALAAAFVAVKAAAAIGNIFSALTSPIGICIVAITALVAAGLLLIDNWDKIKAWASNVWKSVVQSFQNGVASVKNMMNTLGSFVQNLMTFVYNTIVNTFAYIGQGIVNALKKSFNSGIAAIESAINSIIGVINWVFNALSNALSKIGLNWSAWIGTVRLGRFAAGGFPDQGQLFIANEAGPELVGTIGGQTAVANQDQIIEGIRRAVLQAMTEANGSQGNTRSVTLNVNGREFARAIYSDQKAVAREHGISLINA